MSEIINKKIERLPHQNTIESVGSGFYSREGKEKRFITNTHYNVTNHMICEKINEIIEYINKL